jgi:hypothetical protein
MGQVRRTPWGKTECGSSAASANGEWLPFGKDVGKALSLMCLRGRVALEWTVSSGIVNSESNTVATCLSVQRTQEATGDSSTASVPVTADF